MIPHEVRFFSPSLIFPLPVDPGGPKKLSPLRQRNRGARGPRRPEPAENSAVKRGPAI